MIDIMKVIGPLIAKLDWFGVADKILPLIPNNQGQQVLDKGLQVAKTGGTVDNVMDACEAAIPGSLEKINSVPVFSQVWNGMRGKSREEIPTYGRNVATNLNFFKKAPEQVNR